jgi:hypothetical protein
MTQCMDNYTGPMRVECIICDTPGKYVCSNPKEWQRWIVLDDKFLCVSCAHKHWKKIIEFLIE